MTELVQTVVIGVVLGSFFGLLGCGFGIIMGVSGRFHFAYATTFVLSVYVAESATAAGAPFLLAAACGVGASAATGVVIEDALYRPLVQKLPSHALLAVFVTSLGIVIFGENAIRLIWGSDPQTLEPGYTVSAIGLIAGSSMTTNDVMTLAVSTALVVALWLYLRASRFGRATRAVQENPEMATIVGINPRRVYAFVFAVGSAFSGVAGVIFAIRGAVLPDSGLEPTFTALVVVFLAGLRSSATRFGAFGLLIGLIQSFASVYISAAWASVVVFGCLFVFVALTPFLPSGSTRRRLFARAPAAG
jgi:branched-subunit amino acid ABC-type transport system permease component